MLSQNVGPTKTEEERHAVACIQRNKNTNEQIVHGLLECHDFSCMQEQDNGSMFMIYDMIKPIHLIMAIAYTRMAEIIVSYL